MACLLMLKKVCFTLTHIFCYFIIISLAGCSFLNLNDMSSPPCGISIEYAPDLAPNEGQETIWADPKQQEEFCKYWTLRFDGENDKTYVMEAPKFREQATIEKYMLYVKRTKNNVLKRIVINGSGRDDNDLFYVDSNLHLKTKSGDEIVNSIRDKWIEVEGKWYSRNTRPVFFSD